MIVLVLLKSYCNVWRSVSKITLDLFCEMGRKAKIEAMHFYDVVLRHNIVNNEESFCLWRVL